MTYRFFVVIVGLLGLVIPNEERARWKEEWLGEFWIRLNTSRRTSRRERLQGLRHLPAIVVDAFAFRRIVKRRAKRSSKNFGDSMSSTIYGALRSLGRTPVFTIVAIATLALGLGINTITFSVVKTIALDPLPFEQPNQLVQVWERRPAQGRERNVVSYPDFADWRNQNTVFESMAAYEGWSGALTGFDQPEQLYGGIVTHDFFDVLRVAPLRGRLFSAEEDKPGTQPVILLSHEFWQRRFASDISWVGRSVTLDGVNRTIVGILPSGFSFPFGAQYWVPSRMTSNTTSRGGHNLLVIGRLAEGVTLEGANADLDVIARNLESEYPRTNTGHYATASSLREQLIGPSTPILIALSGAVSFVLLIVCANLANMFLARGSKRRREFAIRATLGATRARLFTQAFVESSLLAFAGAALGSVWAVWQLGSFVDDVSASAPWITEIPLESTVFAFTIVLAAATAFAFGIVPALQASRTDLGGTLRDGGERTSSGPRQYRFRQALIAVEVSLALVLLIGAGLTSRSLLRMVRTDPGFSATNVIAADVSLFSSRYDDPNARDQFFRDVVERLGVMPGVVEVGLTQDVPMGGRGRGRILEIEGRPVPENRDELNAGYQIATAGFFSVLQVPIVRGRGFDVDDHPGNPPVAIINETMMATYWPTDDPVNQRFRFGSQSPWIRIVGVAADIRHQTLATPVRPEVFLDARQTPPRSATLLIGVERAPTALFKEVQTAVAASDADLPVSSIRMMEDIVARTFGPLRALVGVMSFFSIVALLLAALGIYGVLSFSVSQRTQEIGVRLALGGERRRVRRMIVTQAMIPVLIGAVAGLFVAIFSTRVMASILFEVGTADLITYVAAVGVLLVVAVAACLAPAARATRMNPLASLRAE